MKKPLTIFLSLIISSLLCAQAGYVIGSNQYQIQYNGDTREYYVHVPKRYTPENNLPVVFMLHGTGSSGSYTLNHSGWKKLGDSLDIITVYPSSWHYCLIKDPILRDTLNTKQWNDYGLQLCENLVQTKRDDVGFINNIIDRLITNFSIDTTRIYMVGFSNGGAMAGRCAIELSHRLAAVVEDGGTLPLDSSFAPRRVLPVLFRIGNLDEMWLKQFPSKSLPMNLTVSKSLFPPFQQLINTHINSFGLTLGYNLAFSPTGNAIAETHNSATGNPNGVFCFMYVKDLHHVYPTPNNHWMYGAKTDWDWMKNYRR